MDALWNNCSTAAICRGCHAAAGVWCKRPSGHRAAELHRARRDAADRAFVAQHGSDAEIRYDEDFDRWHIENTDACASVVP